MSLFKRKASLNHNCYVSEIVRRERVMHEVQGSNPRRPTKLRSARAQPGRFFVAVWGSGALRRVPAYRRRSNSRRGTTRAFLLQLQVLACCGAFVHIIAGEVFRGAALFCCPGGQLRCRRPDGYRQRESGGIGRRPGFRCRCRKACGFESRLSHHVTSRKRGPGNMPMAWGADSGGQSGAASRNSGSAKAFSAK